MKKLSLILLAAALVLAGCGKLPEKAPETTTAVPTQVPAETTQAPVETTQTPVETTEEPTVSETTLPAEPSNGATVILENVWALFTEDELFPIIGGNMENYVDGRPGNYSMEYKENLQYNLCFPADQLENINEASSMIHMMNANTFSAGAVHVKEGVDVAAVAQAIRDGIAGNQWMCGFPDSLYVAVVDQSYVVLAYGMSEAMGCFTDHMAQAYPAVQVLFNEAVEG